MSRRSHNLFETIQTEGGLLPPELLKRIAEGDPELPGLDPESYHLEKGARLGEATTRSWNRLLGAWASFREARGALPVGAPDAALTRERWLLPLFQELGYGRLVAARGIEVEGQTYPISHIWHRTPIHLVGFRTKLDERRAGVAGAARRSPHSLVQELLSRSEAHLWGILSNGLILRLLRDNATLTRQAFVEFDLEAMLDGEVYADFALLWLLCHQSRVEAEQPAGCWLERWAQAARDQGTRALERLRTGVEDAIQALGAGFLAHPRNGALREALSAGSLSTQDYYRELLRLVYRLLFLFVAEDRGLLLDPDAKLDAKRRYVEHYSTSRLRRLAARRRGGPHPDGWRALRLVMTKLGDDAGCPHLALPALGSFLWSAEALPHLAAAELANEHLLTALRALAFTEQGRLLRPVDWRNLDSEELGSVYESLLELYPRVDARAARFELATTAGNERKTTGSYYTPESLVQCLLDTALDPVLDGASRKPNPEAALLALKVCDPAVGSGHFLIAAARRIARRLAQIRTGDAEPDPGALQTSLRDVIGRCLYGVDVNPMAVELCKVSLWLEALEPGRPLSFLDHQIQCGNSLLGTTPALLAKGIPDAAFEPIEGDMKKVAAAFKRQNRAERRGEMTLFADLARDATPPSWALPDRATVLATLPDDSIGAVHRKEDAYRQLAGSEEFRRAKLVADAWCAAFVWPKLEDDLVPPTQEVFLRLSEGRAIPAGTLHHIERMATDYRFLHWHLVFPEVFRPPVNGAPENEKRGSGGFDLVLSNPPWERIKIQEKEWFASRGRTDIAEAPNAAVRKGLIRKLASEEPALYAAFGDDLRRAEGESHFIRGSGRYPLCGRGDLNTYAVFAEAMRDAIHATGRLGAILPAGIATDDTTKHFFGDLVARGSLASLLHFENEEHVFAEVHNAFRFCLLTLSGTGAPVGEADFVCFARRVDQLADPTRRFTLTARDIKLLNPNTRTLPVFRSSQDAELTKWIYRRLPVLVRDGPPEENPWGVSFMAMFHMANDSDLFRIRKQLEVDGWKLAGNIFAKGDERMLPLYEAKMIHQFDHRFGTYEGQTQAQANKGFLPYLDDSQHADPNLPALSKYWVPQAEVEDRLAGRWDRGWLLGWRDVCRTSDVRTVIACSIPRSGVSGKFPLVFPEAPAQSTVCFFAALNSFVFDYCARQKIGGTSLSQFVARQLPILPPQAYEQLTPWDAPTTLRNWLVSRTLELTYTAWDLEPLAKDLGYDGSPFRWVEGRRFLLRCELDAAFFHLCLGFPEEWKAKGEPQLLAAFPTSRDAVGFILESFPIVRRKDEQAHQRDYRTKRVILEIYDSMQRAMESGETYETRLDPPPADPRISHAPTPRARVGT